jgi:hypothetical protein
MLFDNMLNSFGYINVFYLELIITYFVTQSVDIFM